MADPIIGQTCPALSKENYEYHLSGDCEEFCICAINDLACVGRDITDPEDRSSQFFSRGKCSINERDLKKCPLYGVTKETFALILKDRYERELAEKLKGMGT